MTQFHFEGHSLLGFKISEICTVGQIHSQFTSQGHLKVKDISQKNELLHLYTYPKVYVHSFRSLALFLHTEREHLLRTPCMSFFVTQKQSCRQVTIILKSRIDIFSTCCLTEQIIIFILNILVGGSLVAALFST